MLAYMTYYEPESYFRPKAVHSSVTSTPAHVFNLYRLLLMQAKGNCVFVPIRSIQYQAVVTEEEIIFIYAQGGYAIDQHGNGGRIIDLAWHWESHARDSLSAPVSLNLSFYRANLETTQRQLFSLLPAALQTKLDALDYQKSSPEHCRILPFQAPEWTDQ